MSITLMSVDLGAFHHSNKGIKSACDALASSDSKAMHALLHFMKWHSKKCHRPCTWLKPCQSPCMHCSHNADNSTSFSLMSFLFYILSQSWLMDANSGSLR